MMIMLIKVNWRKRGKRAQGVKTLHKISRNQSLVKGEISCCQLPILEPMNHQVCVSESRTPRL